ncbi:hypothetical protein F0919_04305 [Taibaiella lutea]|uniref:Uncharacterized protein n=1 Tax=Taibaiella lutea TaxID=2608001 RepID=A0A5M6CNV6_9BACT|nr:hypothetical protein [Taibaiella lutea]KAA5536901.1 hypothetical protein F0919_04305 [Taibaiella lutea]
METLKERPQQVEEPCFEAMNCLKQECQQKIVDRHCITKEMFDTMIGAFGDKTPTLPHPLAPKTYTRLEIEKMMEPLDCTAGHFIEFTANDNERTSNNDIVLGNEKDVAKGRYSLAFFKGIIAKYGVDDNDKFHFYKAIDSDGNVTLAVKFNAGGTGDVYFADLVGLYPIM